jgi:hypothetical protein
MLLLTGQRFAEVRTMRWQDLDGPWWVIPADVVKNKVEHRMYLGEESAALLHALRETISWKSESRSKRMRTSLEGPWVFPSNRKTGQPIVSVNKLKERSRKRTCIVDWRPHDLRRTLATFLGRMGVSRATIARLLNHLEEGVTAVYDRATREPEIEEALRLWHRRLREILDCRLSDLVRALLRHEVDTVRCLVLEATRDDFEWALVARPIDLDATGLALAAGVTELLASRAGQVPPKWTAAIPAAPKPMFLVPEEERAAGLASLWAREGPEPLRLRGFLAPPNFLSLA